MVRPHIGVLKLTWVLSPLCPRHTARFLFSWLTLLPFALYEKCGPWTVLVVAGVSFALCAVEEIGVQCEEPLG